MRHAARVPYRFGLALILAASSLAGAPVSTRTVASETAVAQTTKLNNPAIDMPGYLEVAEQAAAHRAERRVTEAEFMRLSREPGTIILDARSKEKYDLLHIKGAINLSFPDISVTSLASTLPDPSARILIYCNNNFETAQRTLPTKFETAQRAFPTKVARASLNLSTYIALYTYGYRNIYELAPLIDIDASKLAFESYVTEQSAAR
jgi:phage shock protein E